MIKSVLTLFLMMGCLFFAQAQPGGTWGGMMPEGYIVGGMALDSVTQKPVGFAILELKSASDNKLVDGKMTDSTGKIFFIVKTAGTYYLTISEPGFKTYTSKTFVLSDSNKFVKLGKILLIPIVKTTGAVNIEVTGPIIQNKVDKLVYDASQDISSKGGTAADVLRKAPMVEVDADGNVSMRGSRNIRILLNGKPSAMMNASPREALMTIPADQIDKIEIITNPSAKYDAEGTAGIINIITKQTNIKGKSGSIRLGGGNRSAHLGLNFSIQDKKTSYNFGMGGHFWRTVGTGLTERYNTLNNIQYLLRQESENRSWGGGPRITFGIDHKINKQNSLSFSLTGRGMINSVKSDFDAESGPLTNSLNYLYNRVNNNFTTTLGYDANLDYRKTYNKPERELGISFQYSGNTQTTNYTSDQYNYIHTKTYAEKSSNVGQNNEYTFQMDFTEPIHKKLNMETGVKTIFRKVNSKYNFDSLLLSSNEFLPIQARNNHFVYNQNVYGGYIQFSYLLPKNYSARIGSRYEYTTFAGGYADSQLQHGLPYGNLIPFISINKTIGMGGFARLQYTKRLQRPSLFYLNPYTNYSDPRNLTTGNPNLTAEVSNNFELSLGKYSRKGGGSFNFYHRRINNAIETIRVVDSNGIYRTTYGNIGQNITSGVDINLSLQGKKLTLNFNGGLGYVMISSTSNLSAVQGLSNSGFTYSAGIFGNYKFNKKWVIEGFSRINAPSFSLQGRVQNWYFHSIGVKRRFNNDRGGIGLGMDNPFTPKVNYTTKTSGKDFTYTDVRTVNMFGFRINFDYRFGKMEFQQEQPKMGNGKKKGIKNDDLKEGENQNGGGGSGSGSGG